MRIIETATLENGAHRNQTVDEAMTVPLGWAVIPDSLETENFPFGEITVTNISGIPTVVKWVAGVIPEPNPDPEVEPEPNPQDDTDAMLVDHEYRLTLLELGLTE